MPLTDSQVRNLKPPATGTTTVWDAQNFGVRVSHGGTKTWIVMLGKGRRHTIGHYPLLLLADARKEARRILAEKDASTRSRGLFCGGVSMRSVGACSM